MSSELIVDGVRRPEKTTPLRPPMLLAEGPDDDRAPATEAPLPTLRAA